MKFLLEVGGVLQHCFAGLAFVNSFFFFFIVGWDGSLFVFVSNGSLLVYRQRWRYLPLRSWVVESLPEWHSTGNSFLALVTHG